MPTELFKTQKMTPKLSSVTITKCAEGKLIFFATLPNPLYKEQSHNQDRFTNFEGLVLPNSLAPNLVAFISSRHYSMKTSASFNAWPPRSPPDALIDAEWMKSSAPLKMLLTRAVSYSCQRTDSSNSYTEYPTFNTCSSSHAECGRIFFLSRRVFEISCRSTDCIFQPIYLSFGCPHNFTESSINGSIIKIRPNRYNFSFDASTSMHPVQRPNGASLFSETFLFFLNFFTRRKESAQFSVYHYFE